MKINRLKQMGFALALLSSLDFADKVSIIPNAI